MSGGRTWRWVHVRNGPLRGLRFRLRGRWPTRLYVTRERHWCWSYIESPGPVLYGAPSVGMYRRRGNSLRYQPIDAGRA